MPTSNSLYFTVKSEPALQESGWEVTVRNGLRLDQVAAVITDFVSLSVAPELNAVGLGSITLSADSPLWSRRLPNGEHPQWLLEYEHVWEAWQDGVLRFQWLGETIEHHFVEDDETRLITVSGPGTAQMLTWACVMPSYFPPAQEEPPASLDDPATLTYVPRYDLDWPAMRMWLDQLHRAQGRGTIPWIVPTFTDTADSGGAKWQIISTVGTTVPGVSVLFGDSVQLDAGTNLLDLLNVFTGQDYSKQFAERVEWFMRPGFHLEVRTTIGVHRENQVVFYEGGISQLDRTRTRDEICNYVVTIDQNGSTSFASDTTSMAVWGQREKVNDQNKNITIAAQRSAITWTYLELHKKEKDQWTIVVPYGQPGRVPFVDYDIGDWIGVCLFNDLGGPSVPDIYRVMSIAVHVDGDATTVELTLKTALDVIQHNLEGQITSILNSVANGVAAPPRTVVSMIPTGAGMITWHPALGYVVAPRPIKVYIQGDEPGADAKTGDLWAQ